MFVTVGVYVANELFSKYVIANKKSIINYVIISGFLFCHKLFYKYATLLCVI